MGFPLAAAPLAYALLILIPIISLYALRFDHKFVDAFLFDVSAVRRGEYHRMVTAAFLHASPLHLLVNCLTLFFFGPAVEYIYGTMGFALIFFGSQLGAQAFSLWRAWDKPDYKALGASGAVSGVVLAFCVYAPFELLYLFFFIPVPAILFAAGFIAWSGFAMGGKGRIAHEAHLGGAIAGLVLALLLGGLS